METTEKTLKFTVGDLQLFAEKPEEGQEPDEEEEGDLDPEDLGESEGDDEEGEEEQQEAEEGDKKQPKKQSKQVNAKMAELRRKREEEQKRREEEIRKKAFEEGKKAGQLESQRVNTFTNEPIKDDIDLEIFKLQQKIQEEGGDPIKDLPKRLAQRQRERSEQAKKETEAQEESKKKLQADLDGYYAEFDDREEAIRVFKEDKGFALFRKGKVGNQPLGEIYRDYLAYKKAIGESGGGGDTKTSKTPKPGGNTTKPSSKKVSEMTDEEFTKFYDRRYNDN